MFDDIDEKLTKSLDNIDQNPSDNSLSIEFKKIKQFKHDIINQSDKTQPLTSSQCRMETSFSTAKMGSGKRFRASHPKRALQ